LAVVVAAFMDEKEIDEILEESLGLDDENVTVVLNNQRDEIPTSCPDNNNEGTSATQNHGSSRTTEEGRPASPQGNGHSATASTERRIHHSLCAFCLSPETSFPFKKCGRCQGVTYCSKECQKQDWKRGHKQECQEQQENKEKHWGPELKVFETLYDSWEPKNYADLMLMAMVAIYSGSGQTTDTHYFYLNLNMIDGAVIIEGWGVASFALLQQTNPVLYQTVRRQTMRDPAAMTCATSVIFLNGGFASMLLDRYWQTVSFNDPVSTHEVHKQNALRFQMGKVCSATSVASLIESINATSRRKAASKRNKKTKKNQQAPKKKK